MVEESGEILSSRLAVKLPSFWPQCPELWIKQVESQLAAANIKSDTAKYNALVASLEFDTISQVSDIILNPPAQDKFEGLAKQLIERFAENQTSRLSKLLVTELGDKKPSQLLRDMKNLAAGSLTPEALKILWLQRLPQQISTVLMVSQDNIDNLAVLADRMIPLLSKEVNPVSSCPVTSDLSSEQHIRVLEEKLDRLTKSVDSLSRRKTETKQSTAVPDICW